MRAKMRLVLGSRSAKYRHRLACTLITVGRAVCVLLQSLCPRMGRECTIDRSALLKIVLHAAKFPTSAVNGFLIGSTTHTSSSASASGASPVHVYDAVPVCHNFVTLTPMLECALSQVAEHVKQQKGSRIVGYYQCNERLKDKDLSGIGKKIAERVESLFPDSIALVLDAEALQRCLEGQEGQSVLALYVKDGARGWSLASSGSQLAKITCPTGGLKDLLAAYTSEGRHRKLADFEDHLDDLTQDWLNTTLLD